MLWLCFTKFWLPLEIVNALYEKNPDAFIKSKNAVADAITEEDMLVWCLIHFDSEPDILGVGSLITSLKSMLAIKTCTTDFFILCCYHSNKHIFIQTGLQRELRRWTWTCLQFWRWCCHVERIFCKWFVQVLSASSSSFHQFLNYEIQ